MMSSGSTVVTSHAERVAAEPRRVNRRPDSNAPHLPAVGSSGWFGTPFAFIVRNIS